MDKSIRLRKMARGAVAMGAMLALSLTLSTKTHAGDVAERDLGGSTYGAQSYDPVTGQVQNTPSAESLHGEAVVANSVSPSTQAKHDFANGAKGIGGGFKNGVKATGRGFKTAGTTMGKGFKKAGHGIKWFFTGKWLPGKKNKAQVQERDLVAERTSETYSTESYSETINNGTQTDDLELDFEEETKTSNDWVRQEAPVAAHAS